MLQVRAAGGKQAVSTVRVVPCPPNTLQTNVAIPASRHFGANVEMYSARQNYELAECADSSVGIPHDVNRVSIGEQSSFSQEVRGELKCNAAMAVKRSVDHFDATLDLSH